MKSKGFGGLTDLRGAVRDATAPVGAHAELEAAIAAKPDDVAAYRVYADALEGEGDPRGPWMALHLARMKTPSDKALAPAIDAYLAQHELYLLGGLADATTRKHVGITWFAGFVRRLEMLSFGRAPLTTKLVTDILDVVAALPACRFLRELAISGSFNDVEPGVVSKHLIALGRPTTLESVSICGKRPTGKLIKTFRRLAGGLAAADAALDKVRDVVMTAGWSDCVTLTGAQVRDAIAKIESKLVDAEHFTDAEVDPAVFVADGALACGGGRTADLTVPTDAGAVIVMGDLIVDGVLELPFRGAPVLVYGDLRCKALNIDAHLVVMGDLVVSGRCFGCCTNYPTIVLGHARIGELVLERDHVLDARHG